MKKFVGVDLHKEIIVICVVDKARAVLERRRFYCAETKRIREWFAAQGVFEVVVEATAGYEWFCQLVEPYAERLLLAHPAKLRVIAESTRKSDKLDARVLAEFLALDMIPPAYRPTPRQHEHRRLTRHRCYLRGRLSSIKIRIRQVLSDYNADRRDLFTSAGRAYTRDLDLLAADRFVLDGLFVELDLYVQQMLSVERALVEFAKQAPPHEREARQVLATIPGVGPTTTEIFLAEIADIRRFGSQKKVVAYAGLAPGLRESAGRRQDLGITHTGSRHLRWVLNQAAWQTVRRSPHWRYVFERLAQRRGKRKAIVAVSRRLLCVMASLVMRGEPYRATG